MEPLITIDATAWVTANRTKDSHAVARSEIFCLSKNSDNTSSPLSSVLNFGYSIFFLDKVKFRPWTLSRECLQPTEGSHPRVTRVAILKRSHFGFEPLNLFLVPYINAAAVTIFSLVLHLILLSYQATATTKFGNSLIIMICWSQYSTSYLLIHAKE